MKLYFIMEMLQALAVAVPWASQHLYLPTGLCEVQVWLWLLWGACLGWIASLSLKPPIFNQYCGWLLLIAIGAVSSSAAFLLPPTLGSVPALAALYWACGGVFAAARSEDVARVAREAWQTGSSWSLAKD